MALWHRKRHTLTVIHSCIKKSFQTTQRQLSCHDLTPTANKRFHGGERLGAYNGGCNHEARRDFAIDSQEGSCAEH